MPFGDRMREEVLGEAAGELLQKVFYISGQHVEVGFFTASLKDKIDGLRATPVPGLQGDLLRELSSLKGRGVTPWKGQNEGRGNLDPKLFPNLSHLREADVNGAVRDSLRQAGVTLDPGLVTRLTLEFTARLCGRYKTYPDTLGTLDTLRKRGFTLGIVSNTSIPPEIIDRYLFESGILERVNFRVLSSETGWRKPHPAIYGEALERAGVSPEETLFVGDRFLEDVAGPKSVGMKAALCRLEGTPFPEMSELPDEFMPDFQISELWQLLTRV